MKMKLLTIAVAAAVCASPAVYAKDNKYLSAAGKSITVGQSEADTNYNNRVLGGNRDSSDFKSGSVTVTGGDWNYVIGGSYLGSVTNQTIGFESTSVTVNSTEASPVTIQHVVGGTAGSGANNITSDKAQTRTATLTLNGGSYGNAAMAKANTLENLIVGGDHFKMYRQNGANAYAIDAYLTSTTTNISDATVDSLVIGGSLANPYYTDDNAGVPSAVVSTAVGTAELTITNSTVSQPIVAGGAAFGMFTAANVDTAKLTIEGSTVTGPIFTGGLVRYSDTYASHNGTIEAKTGKSYVTIANSTVKDVYNGRGFAKYDNTFVFSNEEGQSLYDATNDTDTALTLVNSTAETVKITKGSVDLRAEGENGKVTINTLTVGEGVAVTATVDGAINDALKGDKAEAKKLFTVGGYELEDVKLEEGMYIGADGQGASSVMHDAVKTATSTAFSINRILMSDVRKRMGDLRSSEGKSGAWVRYDGGRLSGDGIENDFNTIQVGVDTVPTDNGIRFGIAANYTNGDADYARGSADMDAYGLAFYGTWMGDSGLFADVVARMATSKTDMTIDVSKKGSIDNTALSLSGEVGYRYDVTKTFFVEPQAEVTYTYVDADTMKLSDGSTYDFDASDSLTARLGAVVGLACPKNMGNVYARVSAVHEFLGDTTVTGGNGTKLTTDGKDTWVEFGVGAQYNINPATYVWADVERTEGAALDEDWRATVGVRYAF